MTDKEKLEAIKAYIIDCAKEAEGEIYYEYCKLAGFIESLPNEPVSEDLNRAAVEYAFTTPTTIVESYIAGAKWQKEQMMKDAVKRVKKKMITRAIAWVYWNNRNGFCLFDGWKESLREAMEGE